MKNPDGMTGQPLEQWVADILANPITKRPAECDEFKSAKGVLDARVMLKNTVGFQEWSEGQEVYERLESAGKYQGSEESYRAQIEYGHL